MAVIGGGLQGLEAARGMRRQQCDVTVIEDEGRLMPRQLDVGGAARLAAQIADLGVTVRTGVAVRDIAGETRMTGLTLSTGEQIACDIVIICAGVRPISRASANWRSSAASSSTTACRPAIRTSTRSPDHRRDDRRARGAGTAAAVYPDVAVAEACWACHNEHKDTPRTAFRPAT